MNTKWSGVERFIEYLRESLIADLLDDGRTEMANDLEDAVEHIENLRLDLEAQIRLNHKHCSELMRLEKLVANQNG